jgi:hypothetical protein
VSHGFLLGGMDQKSLIARTRAKSEETEERGERRERKRDFQ